MTMKMVLAIFDSGILPDMMRVLEEREIERWTHWTDVRGAGERNKREGTPIWPGLNDVLLLILPEGEVDGLIERCHEVRDSFPLKPGIRFVVTDCQFI